MDWWQYPQLILLQQISAPEPTTVISFGLSVAILRLTVFLLSANHSFLEPPSSRNRRSYVRRYIQASSSVVPPFISIGVISLLGVCRLLSRSRSNAASEMTYIVSGGTLNSTHSRLINIKSSVNDVLAEIGIEFFCLFVRFLNKLSTA